MTTFLCGLAGALTGLGLLALGALAGWHAHRLRGRPAAPRDREETDRLAEEQRAFRMLQNYSAEQAYGLAGGEEDERR